MFGATVTGTHSADLLSAMLITLLADSIPYLSNLVIDSNKEIIPQTHSAITFHSWTDGQC